MLSNAVVVGLRLHYIKLVIYRFLVQGGGQLYYKTSFSLVLLYPVEGPEARCLRLRGSGQTPHIHSPRVYI